MWTKSGKFQLSGRDGGEDAHAPGFQIMSMTINTNTSDTAAWRRTPVCVRLTASSSAFGAGLPGRLELLRLRHAAHVLHARALPEDRRDHPQDDRRDDPAVPEVVVPDREREPDPEDDRPGGADADGDVADHDHRPQAERSLGRVRRCARPRRAPEEDDGRAVGRRRQHVEREDPVVEGHAAILRQSDRLQTVRASSSEIVDPSRSGSEEHPHRR